MGEFIWTASGNTVKPDQCSEWVPDLAFQANVTRINIP